MNDQEDIKRVSLKWDFGMAPLKDSQISKTVQSIEVFLAYIDNPHVQPTRDQLNCMSYIKDQFTWCVKEDQWNWFTVWTRLGRPDRGDCRRISNSIKNIRDACKQQNPTLLTEAISTMALVPFRVTQSFMPLFESRRSHGARSHGPESLKPLPGLDGS